MPQRHWTELSLTYNKLHGLVFDELTNVQATKN